MLFWSIQSIIISLIFIFLVHHLIDLLKYNLTVPKTKDLVNNPTQVYKNIYEIISRKDNENKIDVNQLLPNVKNHNEDDFNGYMETNVDNENNMKKELSNFLKELYEPSNNDEFSNYERF